MATDFGEKERAFIEGLKENTGRSLDEWMQAISAIGISQRNDVIEWLRHQGLMFSKASWLERIHHNGGKPIYAGVTREAAPRRPPARRGEMRLGTPPLVAIPAAPAPVQVTNAAPVPKLAVVAPLANGGELDALLAKAKAYRPLAQHVLTKIRQVCPGADISLRESAVAIGAPAPFALLGISARELRLHLALGEHPFDESVKKGQAGGGLGKGDALSHMLVLTDARQLDGRFLELIAQAAANAAS
ncbi:MAG: DUF5655 domain-containing protein [Hyphomicrobium sp.]|jgi:hypothetical protein